jgi:hypothetical protein
MTTKAERRKMEGINQFRLQFIHTWKCHHETPFRHLKQIKMSFFKNKGQVGKTCPIWELVPVGGRMIQGKSEGGEYGGNTTFSCMKVENETF